MVAPAKSRVPVHNVGVAYAIGRVGGAHGIGNAVSAGGSRLACQAQEGAIEQRWKGSAGRCSCRWWLRGRKAGTLVRSL